MPSYRFCRPDDIPYLVRAVNECYDVYFPHAPEMTVERFRDEMKRLDVWPSNSMVATTNAGPVAVLIGTKRATEVLVLRLGVHPDYRGEGHGAHLLTSLSQKLAVLGPERLLIEVPRELSADGFLSGLGYEHETTYTDYVRDAAPAEPVPEDLIAPVTVAELDDQGLLDVSADVAWERRRETLLGSKDGLEGSAVAGPERIEAYVLHRPADDGETRDVVAAGSRAGGDGEAALGLLLRHLAGRTELPLKLPKLADGELPASVLEAAGFAAGAVYDRYGAKAEPA